uniref:MLO-like protein n=1 Tax=Cannabis sativa TaxID=3483 RepID=A0A803QH70_CANSA
MAEEDSTTTEATLERTPTWAVATVCFVLILVSIIIEHLLHRLAKFLNKRRKKSLLEALDKIKSELMLLGFVSLFLTISEKTIANICIPESVGHTFLPCGTQMSTDVEEEAKCAQQDKVSLLSRNGVRQLQYLIFVLAVSHVFSCVLTFGFGIAKMMRWEAWEAETRTLDYQFSNDPRRFKLIHQTSFGKRHLHYWSQHRILRWPICFLRQFYKSVSKVDYLTLRHGFIMAHFDEGTNFDFQKYIRRALENDFRVVVGIKIERHHSVGDLSTKMAGNLTIGSSRTNHPDPYRPPFARGSTYETTSTPAAKPYNRSFFSNGPRPLRQVCLKLDHTVAIRHYRFDKAFITPKASTNPP